MVVCLCFVRSYKLALSVTNQSLIDLRDTNDVTMIMKAEVAFHIHDLLFSDI